MISPFRLKKYKLGSPPESLCVIKTSFIISKPEVSFMIFGRTIVSRITAFSYSSFFCPFEQLNIITQRKFFSRYFERYTVN